LKIEIKYHRRKYYFLVKAGNGRILLRSVAYNSMQQCLHHASLLKETVQDGSRFERKKVGQRLQLIVKDVNGQIMAMGHQYSNVATFNQGVRATTSLVREAQIVTEGVSESK
jgi:uncharacterized protein YegP (UPF0339 family)